MWMRGACSKDGHITELIKTPSKCHSLMIGCGTHKLAMRRENSGNLSTSSVVVVGKKKLPTRRNTTRSISVVVCKTLNVQRGSPHRHT